MPFRVTVAERTLRSEASLFLSIAAILLLLKHCPYIHIERSNTDLCYKKDGMNFKSPESSVAHELTVFAFPVVLVMGKLRDGLCVETSSL